MLSDIKVLDLTTFLSGPFCTMTLADMGADVIKIETPEKGCATRKTPPFIHGESAYYMSLNRGKRSLTLDLKSKQGKKSLPEACRCHGRPGRELPAGGHETPGV